MRICHLINSLSAGGAESLLVNIIRHTDEQADYTVYYLGGDDTLTNDLQQTDANVCSLDARFNYDPIAISHLFSYLYKKEFDIIHAHLPNSHWIARVIGRMNGTDIVSTHHSMPKNYQLPSRTLERLTRPLDSVTVAISDSVRAAFDSSDNPSWRTIYNGIDVQKFEASVVGVDTENVKKEWNVNNNHIFLNVGRYITIKGQFTAIKAMSLIVEQIPDSHLFIVGWGPLEDDLRNEVARFNLEEHVTITGKSTAVEEFYAIADVFVHPAHLEGFGIVILEAMASKLPVIATNLPAIQEIITEDTGVLVPQKDPEKLAKMMLSMTQQDRRARLGFAGYERVKNEFTIEQTAEQYMSLYKELHDKGS